jgi:formate/nitrite transporter FocA (FNT family)
MKLDPKATKAELIKIIQDLRDEATGWHQRAKTLEDELAGLFAENASLVNAKLHRMGDRKPWKLIAITAGIAFGMGVIVGVVV